MATELADANTRITEITTHEKELADKIKTDEAATKTAIAEYTETHRQGHEGPRGRA